MKVSHRKTLVKFTSAVAWIFVLFVMIKAAISIYHFLHNETTNDAQVVEYINPVINRELTPIQYLSTLTRLGPNSRNH